MDLLMRECVHVTMIRLCCIKVISITLIILFAACIPTGAADDITVTPRSVNVFFDSPAKEEFHADQTVTVTNIGDSTVRVDIDTPPNFKPIESFELEGGESRQIEIIARKGVEEGVYYININAGEVVNTVTVNVIHCAKLTVSPSELDFGEVSCTKTASREIQLREECGFKSLTDVTITQVSGDNDWVKPSLSRHISVNTSARTITFTLNPGCDYSRRDNSYTWQFAIRSDSRCVSPATLTIHARIIRPAKLGPLPHAKKIKIKFDKPKGTVSNYKRDIRIDIENLGDEPMTVKIDHPASLGGGIQVDAPDELTVPGRSTRELKLHITVPYDTPEGIYEGTVHLDAGKKAGEGDIDISVEILWPVDFTISSPSRFFSHTSRSIDFGSLQLKEQGYEYRGLNLTLTEYYRYKPVRNLRFFADGEYANWLKEWHESTVIPPGESINVTIEIQPGLEAVPKSYSWRYYISAREISAKQLQIKAKIVPMDIPKTVEYLKSFRDSQLCQRYPSSDRIISSGTELLQGLEQSDISEDDWRKIPVLIRATLSLLSALNDGISQCANGSYDLCVENLVSASVSTSIVRSNSVLGNHIISACASNIATSANTTAREVLRDEAKMLELRAWQLKKAVAHAAASNSINELKEDENVLESALSYQHAATLYGLLGERHKSTECHYEQSKMLDWHDKLVSGATDLRIRAEGIIADSKERDLFRFWNSYMLMNPYNYDTFASSYETAAAYLEEAAQKYRLAGEPLLYHNTISELNELHAERSRILSLFLLSCVIYAILFLYVLIRIIDGTVSYLKDTYEREIGDFMVSA